MSFFRDQLEAWLKTIDVDAKSVCDVGGAQLPVRGRVKSWNVEKYEIRDLAKPHQKDATVTDYIIDNIELGGIQYGPQYDVVFCLEVMEYVLNPRQVIQNLFDMMRSEGILYISFPFVYPNHNPDGADMLRYTKYAVGELLTDAGFEIDMITPRLARSPEALTAFYHSDGMHPVRDETIAHTGYLVQAHKPA